MMPAFDGFMQRYPEIELDIGMSDRMVDVIEEGFDAVIRTGEQHDSRLAARRLGDSPHVLVATPEYLERHGRATQPEQRLLHFCLQDKFPATGQLERWPFSRDASEPDLMLPETLTANTVEALAYAVLQGRGITFFPSFLVREELESGRLVTVLDDYVDRTVSFWMLWPASRFASPKLRVFIDYTSEHLRI